MTTPKRGRGRPGDASIYREVDHAKLELMADLILVSTGLKPDTAMARIGVHEDRVKRRLRRRWKRYGVDHLARAQVRLQARTPQTSMESVAVALTGALTPSIRRRRGLPGDVGGILSQYRALGDFHKIGAIAGLVKLAVPCLIDPVVADQISAKSMLGDAQQRATLAKVMGISPGSAIRSAPKIGHAWRELTRVK